MSGTTLLEVVPLAIAAFYYLLSPFFNGLVRDGFVNYLEKTDDEWQGPITGLPPHRTTEALSANIDWVIDAPQMIPGLLLPLTAGIFALADQDAAAAILAFATVLICAATLWIYTRSPVEYRSLRLIGHRYTVVSVLGVILNAVTAMLILIK